MVPHQRRVEDIRYVFYFLFMDLTQSSVTQKPKYSISVLPKYEFSILYSSPFPFSLLRIISTFCRWSIQSHFLRIKREYMYAQMNYNSWNKAFILYWKMSDEIATPIGRRLYQYFPHGRIILHKLLAFFLRLDMIISHIQIKCCSILNTLYFQ